MLDEPVNDLVAVGAVADRVAQLIQLAGCHKYVVGRHVDHLPIVTENTGDDLLAATLEQHRQQETDVIVTNGQTEFTEFTVPYMAFDQSSMNEGKRQFYYILNLQFGLEGEY